MQPLKSRQHRVQITKSKECDCCKVYWQVSGPSIETGQWSTSDKRYRMKLKTLQIGSLQTHEEPWRLLLKCCLTPEFCLCVSDAPKVKTHNLNRNTCYDLNVMHTVPTVKLTSISNSHNHCTTNHREQLVIKTFVHIKTTTVTQSRNFVR
jgi:hypothetical protein